MKDYRKPLRGMIWLFAVDITVGALSIAVLALNAWRHTTLLLLAVSVASMCVMFFTFFALGMIWSLRGQINESADRIDEIRRLTALFEENPNAFQHAEASSARGPGDPPTPGHRLN